MFAYNQLNIKLFQLEKNIIAFEKQFCFFCIIQTINQTISVIEKNVIQVSTFSLLTI